LNKTDLFQEKLKTVKLSVRARLPACPPARSPRLTPRQTHFPDYNGDNTFDNAKEFVKDLFIRKGTDSLTRDVYPHFTCATDTNNVEKVC
jgi:guanine nucleotide-binding protein G(t) subunit alpha